ncbi:hypothetical protein C1H46_004091 [Malus baccata]|uniref:Retinoblastoma-associated protein A-box domain-containing protein n=1 Tax=Malus baccata TaxID=106549 RepID=A0A540NGU8_MALBA|nr:hypothetical protein C1H46_004091 [Malus baccata]
MSPPAMVKMEDTKPEVSASNNSNSESSDSGPVQDRFTDLCKGILIIHVPVRFRKFSIHDSTRFARKGNKGVDLLACLCNTYNTSEDELRKTMEMANGLIAEILKKKPVSASDYKTENLENMDPDGLTYFEGLMEEPSLLSSLEILEKDYDDAIRNKGEVDERVFINEDDSLLGSWSFSGGSMSVAGVKRKFDSMASPTKTITSPLSPHRSPASHVSGGANSTMVATPVSTAMTTAKWLRTFISPLPSQPSTELEGFLASCDRDVTTDVIRRAQIILEAIFPSSALGERCVSGSLQGANLMDNIWSEQRRLEALKLYYRVLEAMCRAEAQNGDIRSPKRSCTDYRSILLERNSFTSPVKDRPLALSNLKSKLPPPPLQSAFASPTRPNPGGGGETCAETGISIFFSKIIKLAAVRINGMVERMQLSQQIRENVYRLFQQILVQRTSLFFNRHIDQIILCCFYGVSKISQLNLTFREIIYNYRKQPQCKPQVFRSVFVEWPSARRNGRPAQEHVDIITFYNEIFIPSVKTLLVELGPAVTTTTRANMVPEVNNNNDAPCPGSPKVSTFPSLPDMSPKKVSAAHNVYVSPLRSSKMDALISHSSKSYYACVGESTHAYQSPSKDLTAINNRLNGTRKLRGTLNFDSVDVGLVSDSMVANSLYLQNGSCATSSGAPVKTEQPDS